MIAKDHEGYKDYMGYVEAIADPHWWYMYDPMWLRRFGGIDNLDEQARYEIHEVTGVAA